tara:strand:+ start:298 stop:489 length:192 start_codon:yes stop_codon:yes gene_type:complete
MNITQEAFESKSFKLPPQPVGGYRISPGSDTLGSIMFNFIVKPNWFHRTCCKIFLGWTWIDKI